MHWEKKGVIFKPNNEYGWIRSHAQIPTILVLNDVIRIYFATRPKDGLSVVAMMDLDICNPNKILKLYRKPILEPGEKGGFDEHGTMPNFVYKENDVVYMYYVGWSRRTKIPYSNWQGLAVSEDDGVTFKKKFRGPVLDRTKDEIFSAVGVNFEKIGNSYYGCYVTGTKWINVDGRLESAYEIVPTKSKNLIDWERSTIPILPKKIKNEANTRPTFIRIDDCWHMWFCYRGVEDFRDGKNSYRIGYAYSNDLKNWNRDDAKAGIDLSSDGWDASMMCYPYVVKVKDKYLMFYNGNGFGQTGFGYAELRMC